MAELNRVRIVYYDESRAPDVVVIGQWEAILADRKFGEGAISRGNLDAVTFAAYMGARRCGLISDGQSYDGWAEGVAQTEEAEPGESPAPPAT